jgi:hypothetical protein
MSRLLVFCLLLWMGSTTLSSAQATASPKQIETELRSKTQELLDAIAPGHVQVWRKYLHERVVHVDENGIVRTKEELLKELTPLPAGLEGRLEIASFKVEIHGSVAVVTHEDQEHLAYHGQQLASRFRATDTWLNTADGWRLIASQILALQKDPPAATLTEDQLCAYNGVFALTEEITETIRCKAGALSAVRSGRAEVSYKPETADVFFAPGRPRTRRIFKRDAAGKVTGFVDRREGEDIVWRKLR